MSAISPDRGSIDRIKRSIARREQPEIDSLSRVAKEFLQLNDAPNLRDCGAEAEARCQSIPPLRFIKRRQCLTDAKKLSDVTNSNACDASLSGLERKYGLDIPRRRFPSKLKTQSGSLDAMSIVPRNAEVPSQLPPTPVPQRAWKRAMPGEGDYSSEESLPTFEKVVKEWGDKAAREKAEREADFERRWQGLPTPRKTPTPSPFCPDRAKAKCDEMIPPIRFIRRSQCKSDAVAEVECDRMLEWLESKYAAKVDAGKQLKEIGARIARIPQDLSVQRKVGRVRDEAVNVGRRAADVARRFGRWAADQGQKGIDYAQALKPKLQLPPALMPKPVVKPKTPYSFELDNTEEMKKRWLTPSERSLAEDDSFMRGLLGDSASSAMKTDGSEQWELMGTPAKGSIGVDWRSPIGYNQSSVERAIDQAGELLESPGMAEFRQQWMPKTSEDPFRVDMAQSIEDERPVNWDLDRNEWQFGGASILNKLEEIYHHLV